MKKIFSDKKILILGATGLIGGALMDRLQSLNADVSGTTSKKKKEADNYLELDVLNLESVNKFPWERYNIIVDCIGNIDYQNTLSVLQKNILINTRAPLKILARLSARQKYFYCSSYVVLLSENQHNSYSLSKLFLERSISLVPNIKPSVTILRIPGVFSEQRKNGLIYLIKQHFYEKKKLELDFTANKWHIIYLPRLAEIIVNLLIRDCPEKVNLGYATEISIEKIISIAKNLFGYSIPINFKQKSSDHFVPDLSTQSRYLNITERDFKLDLIKYFKS